MVAVDALERLDNGDKEGAIKLCPWFTRDINSGLCFWKLLDRENEAIETFKEIGKLLSEPESEVKSSFESGINKIRSSDSEDVKLFIEELLEVTRTAVDPDIYEADRLEMNTHEDESTSIVRGFSEGLVVHKGGKKVQIYGLSKKHSQLMREYNKQHPEAQATFSSGNLHRVEKEKKPRKLRKPKGLK